VEDLDDLLARWDENPVQVLLDLPQVNIKETRRKMFKVFAAYRRFKRQLLDGEDFDIIRVGYKPKAGYEDATDPDQIRAPYRLNWEPGTPPAHERRIRSFIDYLDYRVRRLPDAQRELIRRRYLSLKPHLPKDIEVFMELKKKRLVMSEREYDREKREALMELAEAMNVIVFDFNR